MRAKFRIATLSLLSISLLFGCIQETNDHDDATGKEGVVNVYSHRHYDSDKLLFDKFTEATGIKVNLVKAKADELINRIEIEGKNCPADLLLTIDAGRLYRAKEKNMLQPVNSALLNANIPENLRDPEGYWFGLTYRARMFVYNKENVKPDQLSTYEDLTSHQWKGKILIRSSENIYNQSLLASMIATQGREVAKNWAEGIVQNMVRDPRGNDRDQIKAVAAGIGDVALVNSYYVALLLNSQEDGEREAGEKVGIYFPNQSDRGTHINVSGVGIPVHSPNKQNAIRLIEFLSGISAQEQFALGNYEYPVNSKASTSPLLQSWGKFRADTLNLALLGEYNREAVMVFNEAGWK